MNKALSKLIEDEQKKAVSKIVNSTEQSYGFVSCGFPFIDIAVSPKGLFPRGTVSEIMGLKSTCKTTLVLQAIGNEIAKARSSNNPLPNVLWADFENQLLEMKQYALALGVDIGAENFIHIRPSTLEDGTNFILNAVKTGDLQFVVVDSNAAMRPEVEDEKGVGGTHVKGRRSFLISEFLRNLTGNMSGLANQGIMPPTVIIINQVYLVLNIGGPPISGPPQYDSPGSGAIKFYAAVRIEVKVAGYEYRQVTDSFTFAKEKVKSATFIQLFVEKSKVSIPHGKVRFVVRYGEGVDPIFTFIKTAEELSIVSKVGSSSRYQYPDSEKSFQGFYGVYDYFRQNPEEMYKLAGQFSQLQKWEPILRARVPWMDYSHTVMQESLEKLSNTEVSQEFVDIEQGEL